MLILEIVLLYQSSQKDTLVLLKTQQMFLSLFLTMLTLLYFSHHWSPAEHDPFT